MTKKTVLVLVLAALMAAIPLHVSLADGPTKQEMPAGVLFSNPPLRLDCVVEGETLVDFTGTVQMAPHSSGDLGHFHVHPLGRVTAVGSVTGDTYLVMGSMNVLFVDGQAKEAHGGMVVSLSNGAVYRFHADPAKGGCIADE